MLLDQQHLEAHVTAQRLELATALRHASAVAEVTPRRTRTWTLRLAAVGREMTSLRGHLRWRRHHPVWVRRPMGA